MPISIDTARQAHEWYMEEPTRSIEETAAEFGFHATSMRRAWVRFDLPRKGVHDAKVGKRKKNNAAAADTDEYVPHGARVVRPSVQRIQRRWR